MLPLDADGHQAVPDDHRLRHRVVRRRRRHVARALPDHRPVARPQVLCPTASAIYRPQPVEIIIAGATFAAMTLLYMLFAKFVPIISIWELKAGEHVPPTLVPSGDTRSIRSGSCTCEGHLRAVSRTGRRRSRRSTGCARRVSPTARSRCSRPSRWRTTSSASMDKATWMWWIACGGGLVGMATAFGLTWLTETSWPINVGGLPDLCLVAQPDHHLRADDARRDRRHSGDAGRHRAPGSTLAVCTIPRCPTGKSWSGSSTRPTMPFRSWRRRSAPHRHALVKTI